MNEGTKEEKTDIEIKKLILISLVLLPISVIFLFFGLCLITLWTQIAFNINADVFDTIRMIWNLTIYIGIVFIFYLIITIILTLISRKYHNWKKKGVIENE